MDAAPVRTKIFYSITGLVLGAGLCLGVVYLFDSDRNRNNNQQAQILTLEVTSPGNSTAVSQKTITVSGSSGVSSIVTINSPLKQTIVEAKDGNFSTQVELTEGKNVIEVVAFDPSTGESQTQKRDVLYLAEELKDL